MGTVRVAIHEQEIVVPLAQQLGLYYGVAAIEA